MTWLWISLPVTAVLFAFWSAGRRWTRVEGVAEFGPWRVPLRSALLRGDVKPNPHWRVIVDSIPGSLVVESAPVMTIEQVSAIAARISATEVPSVDAGYGPAGQQYVVAEVPGKIWRGAVIGLHGCLFITHLRRRGRPSSSSELRRLLLSATETEAVADAAVPAADVVAEAERMMRRLLPELESSAKGDVVFTRIGAAQAGWSLARVLATRASGKGDWKAQLEQEAAKQAITVRAMEMTGVGGPGPLSASNALLRLANDERLAMLRAQRPDLVSEPVAPGLHLVFAQSVAEAGHLYFPTRSELETIGLVAHRTAALSRLDPEALQLAPVDPALDFVFTNHAHDDNASLAVLRDDVCQSMARKLGTPFLVLVPAASRVFFAKDGPNIVQQLTKLANRSAELEEAVLSTRVYRVDDGRWSVADQKQ